MFYGTGETRNIVASATQHRVVEEHEKLGVRHSQAGPLRSQEMAQVTRERQKSGLTKEQSSNDHMADARRSGVKSSKEALIHHEF
jgi:hypothetical protein